MNTIKKPSMNTWLYICIIHNWNTFQICWEKLSVSIFHWYVLKNNSYRLYFHIPPPQKKMFFSSTSIEFHTSLNRTRTAQSCSETIRSDVNLNCHFKTFHVNTAFWLTVLFWLRTNEDWLPAVWLGLNKTAPAAAYRCIILLFLILWLIGVFFLPPALFYIW